jgi:L-iditol 2-dehydrogenase
MPSKTCFPLPETLSDIEGALLEPLGVGIHAVDLAKVKLGDSAAILGAGPIGLLILQLARLAGAGPIIVTDRFPWRLEMARQLGADTILQIDETNPVGAILDRTDGRGVDIVWEAAWGTETVTQAPEVACLGGRLILVGIPSQDLVHFRASGARRKGLTIKMARRMKHTYPRAIQLAANHKVELMRLVTHRFSLAQAAAAFALNVDYQDGIIKAVIEG